MRIVSVILLCTLIVPLAGAGVGFRDPPEVLWNAGGFAITFSDDGTTDVEIVVLDATGKVVRHFAAGVLRPDAPPPLLPGLLAQRLTWAGRDGAQVSNRRLRVLDTDGGVPDNFLGPLLANRHATGFARLAAVAGRLYVALDDGSLLCMGK